MDLNYNTVNLFPSIIHQFDVNGFDEIQNQLIDYAYQFKNKDPEGVIYSNHGGWQSPNFDIEDENHEAIFKDLDHANGLFLKSNCEQLDDIDHSKDKNKMTSTPVRRPFENKNEKYENLSYGSQTAQNFAKNLSEKLKILKPIK